MTAARIVLLIFAIIIMLVAIGLLFTGGALVWVDVARTDDEGFVGTTDTELNRASRAIATPPIDLDEEAIDVLRWIDLSTVRLVGENNNPSKQVFMGIGRDSDVQDYLDDVNHDEMSRLTHWISFDIEYENIPGDRAPAPPASETFWVASAHGPGTQTLDWEPEEGIFAIVLMNEDASPGVDLTASLRAKVDTPILPVGIGFLVGGVVLLAIAVVMVYFSTRSKGAPETAPPTVV